ncbi:efflux transporter periplasmic adaptor subunit [Novosphingobium sp. PC22D]|uniref:efflux RND transporter periplasmic adaptor subunit n=1 Tax=Novosphingobium sp. PC22D TaxID=1962403 RepID=UPI000BEF2714|nr:efflux RND transporter periplasmic adaptor subunit [Novosphingobium sp. PC22D]PEQ13136.1 efflux transporter periplasmic adaptor subunit [Novosphingobium sp. PC22D]
MTGADSVEENPRDRFGPKARNIVLAVVALAVLLGLLFAWRAMRNGGGPMPPRQAVPVAALVATPRDVPNALEAVGTLTAVREVTLSPEAAGRVSAIRFKAGNYVGSGSLLVQLYDGPERADRKAALASAKYARLQLERTEKLIPSGAESRELLEQRRAERDQAVAAVEQIDARIRQKQVRAPFAGRLGIRRVDLGQYLNPGDPVATLTALDSLYVEFAVPQQELTRLEPGTTVSVSSDAYPGRRFTARVNAVEPVIDGDTRNVTVQAVMRNPDQALRPGMYVTAALALPPRKGAIVVPATAIQTSAQGDSVVIIRGKTPKKTGKAEIVPVKTGARLGNSVIVTQGIEPGDVVVAQGQLRVQPGAEVKVTQIVPLERK